MMTCQHCYCQPQLTVYHLKHNTIICGFIKQTFYYAKSKYMFTCGSIYMYFAKNIREGRYRKYRGLPLKHYQVQIRTNYKGVMWIMQHMFRFRPTCHFITNVFRNLLMYKLIPFASFHVTYSFCSTTILRLITI